MKPARCWTVPCWRKQIVPPLFSQRWQAQEACQHCLSHPFCRISLDYVAAHNESDSAVPVAVQEVKL